MKHYIALADCDCFFVSAERAFNPRLDGRAVAVLSNNDGCVKLAVEEAKALGLKMGEPYFMARNAHRRFCMSVPITIFTAAFRQKSWLSSNRLRRTSSSVDEAYLDLTGTKLLYRQNYIKTAQMIRQAVWDELHIPVSIGLSTTKTLAKLASDKAKNAGGVFAIGSAERNKILTQTLIADVSGVGESCF